MNMYLYLYIYIYIYHNQILKSSRNKAIPNTCPTNTERIWNSCRNHPRHMRKPFLTQARIIPTICPTYLQIVPKTFTKHAQHISKTFSNHAHHVPETYQDHTQIILKTCPSRPKRCQNTRETCRTSLGETQTKQVLVSTKFGRKPCPDETRAKANSSRRNPGEKGAKANSSIRKPGEN